MCLSILGCQLVMYNSTDSSSCTIYNSTNGISNSLDGHIIYMVMDTMTTISTTTEAITTTTITTTTEVGTSSTETGDF